MKKFELGILQNAEVGQRVRLMSGPLADYDQIWTIVNKSEGGDMRLNGYGSDSRYFWGMETEVMEIEIA